MKNILVKSAMALAISAVAAPVASVSYAEGMEAPAVTVSGRFRGGLVYTDPAATDADSHTELQNRSSRFRIAAQQDLGNGLSVFGKYEFQVELDEGRLRGGLKGISVDPVTNPVTGAVTNVNSKAINDNTRRLSYVGLKGGFGEVSIGSRWTPFYLHVTSPIDATNLLGGTWQPVGYISPFRRGDQIMYKGDFGPVKFGAGFAFDEDPGDGGNDVVDNTSIGATFAAGPASIGLGYDGTTDGDDLWGINVSVPTGPISWGLSYFNRDADEDLGGFDSAAYTLQAVWGFGNRMSLVTQLGGTNPDIDSQPEPTYLAFELVQKMSDNARWFAGVETTDPDLEDADNRTRVGAGLRFDF